MAARTVEERIAIIDEKISKKKADIKVLEAQKQKLLHPVTMKTVMEKQKPPASLQRRSQKNSVLKCDPKILNG